MSVWGKTTTLSANLGLKTRRDGNAFLRLENDSTIKLMR
jgi:hypothetical protein